MAGVGPTTGIQSKLYFTATVPTQATDGEYTFNELSGSGMLRDTASGKAEANVVDGVVSSGAMEQSANTISVGVLGEDSQRTYPGQTTPAEFTFEVVIDYANATHIVLEGLTIGDDGFIMFYTAKASAETIDWAKVQLAGKSKQLASDDVGRVSYTWTLPDGPFATLSV